MATAVQAVIPFLTQHLLAHQQVALWLMVVATAPVLAVAVLIMAVLVVLEEVLAVGVPLVLAVREFQDKETLEALILARQLAPVVAVAVLVPLGVVAQKLIPLVMEEQVLLQPFQEQLLLTQVAVVEAVTLLVFTHLVVLVEVVMGVREMRREALVLQTLAVAVAGLEILRHLDKQAVLVVQGLSFSDTPAQFNISLVAQ
jgi:hypothetical protein